MSWFGAFKLKLNILKNNYNNYLSRISGIIIMDNWRVKLGQVLGGDKGAIVVLQVGHAAQQ